jgi:hypothetical protein
MFKVIAKGQEFKASEDVAIKEWMKGAKVYSSCGMEVTGVQQGVTGEFFIYD